MTIFNFLLVTSTLRIASPWAVVNMKKREIINQVGDVRPLIFMGKAINLLKK